jgi:hypothetical protein
MLQMPAKGECRVQGDGDQKPSCADKVPGPETPVCNIPTHATLYRAEGRRVCSLKKPSKARKRVWIMKSLTNRFSTLVVLASVSIVPSVTSAKGPSAVSSRMASNSMTTAANRTGSTSNPTISFSNGTGSNTIQSNKIISTSQPGGYHGNRNQSDSSVASTTLGSLTQKSSTTTVPVGASTSLPTGGGSVKEPLVVHPKQVKDDPLGDLNSGLNALTGAGNPPSSGPNGQQSETGANALTNGSQGQYGDGGTMAPLKGSPSAAPAPAPASKKVSFGTAVQLNGSYATIAAANEIKKTTTTTPIQNKIGTSQAAQQPQQPTQTNPSTPTPSPSNPAPKPMPYPSGPVFGGGSSGGSSTVSTSDSSTTPAATATPTSAPATDSNVDLVLEDVQLAAPATLVAGPAFTVKFRNQGTQAAGKFQVGIFAGLTEKLVSDSPKAVVEVKSLAAGDVQTVTLRLPQKALKLTGADNKPTAFTHLFVAVDLTNAVAETDETNNTAVIERAALESGAAN